MVTKVVSGWLWASTLNQKGNLRRDFRWATGSNLERSMDACVTEKGPGGPTHAVIKGARDSNSL